MLGGRSDGTSQDTAPIIEQPEDPAESKLLLLVNKDNKLPDNYVPDLSSGLPIDEVLFDDFVEMRKEANREQVFLMIASAYRTADEQEKLFNELGAEVAAPAGYSEHQTGLAIDFAYNGRTQEETDRMWNWLSRNAYRYGFIERYPEGKEHVTGFDFEPWHYRYVGRQHAKNIYEKGLVLEEYIGRRGA